MQQQPFSYFWQNLLAAYRFTIYPLILEHSESVKSGFQSLHPPWKNVQRGGEQKQKNSPIELVAPLRLMLMRNVSFERVYKHIFYFFHLGSTQQTLPSRLPLRFRARRAGAALYHSTIFFKEAKRRECLKATHCLLSPTTI